MNYGVRQYLSVVIDRFSRKVVGWALERTLAARLALTALRRAIAARKPGPGLVHHSDRGFQYACNEYVEEMQLHKMEPSMSRPANPYDNAACESFMKTLKQEEIYCNQYRDMEELHEHIEEFIDRYYNRQRLHSALGYRTPEEFEKDNPTRSAEATTGAAKMKYFRNPQSRIEKSASGNDLANGSEMASDSPHESPTPEQREP